ncbi:MAG: putative porin [Bacteroidia bacterium]
MLYFFRWSLSLFLLFPLVLFAQDNDSASTRTRNITRFFTAGQFNTDSSSTVDNSLRGFQNYLPHDDLGNAGLAIHSPLYNSNPTPAGFIYAPNNFNDYFYSPKTQKFFNTHSPFTDLRYIFGSKQEQSFKMTFSYNVKKNWNLTADFFRIRSDGFYLRQRTNDNFFSASTSYQSKRNRYCLLAALNYNYVQNQENGGIQNDSIFVESGNTDKKLIAINLQSAKMSFLQRKFFLRQYLNFGKAGNDSSAIVPSGSLILTSSVEDNLFRYIDEDPEAGFYQNIYHDSSRTHDSAYYFLLDNKMEWKRMDNHKHQGIRDWFGLGLSLDHQLVRLKQWETDTTWNGMIAAGELYNTYSNRKFWYHIGADYTMNGYNEGDMGVSVALKKGIIDSLTFISVHAWSETRHAGYMYQHYSSNHFYWNNNSLLSVSRNDAGFDFRMQKYSLAAGADLMSIQNPVYFDNFGNARQYSGTIPVISAWLKKNFRAFNWHLDNDVHYQYVPDSTVIRLPTFVLQHSLYYENDIKNIMRIQVGASVYFTTAYYADAYMPATAQFYLQSDRKYGNYPFLDVFVNARVKNVRVFLKVDHLNAGWGKNDYISTPHYPYTGRAFKLGISWRFYD